MLDVSNISLRFGGLSVLQGVSFIAKLGEVTALIGPNGAGKSALLNCISGHYQPTSGSRISVDGDEVATLAVHRRAQAGVARTFQHVHLVPEFTVLENVMTGWTSVSNEGLLASLVRPLRHHQLERCCREVAREALDAFGLTQHADAKAAGLPLGLRRRVDFARAMVSRPRVLLLDEPTSGMSRAERDLMPRWVQDAQARQPFSVVWIEHDVDLLLSISDSMYVLQHGEVIASGRPRERPPDRQIAIDAYFGRSV